MRCLLYMDITAFLAVLSLFSQKQVFFVYQDMCLSLFEKMSTCWEMLIVVTSHKALWFQFWQFSIFFCMGWLIFLLSHCINDNIFTLTLNYQFNVIFAKLCRPPNTLFCHLPPKEWSCLSFYAAQPALQLDCRSTRRTCKINLQTNQEGYDKSETTVGKFSASRIQIYLDYFVWSFFDLLSFKTS